MDIELSAPGQIVPPVDRAIAAAKKMEDKGYDGIWWNDHLMGWIPDSLWHEDFTPIAAIQESAHENVEPFSMIAAAGVQTEKIRFGTCVTDILRRHPASVAQTILTLDHVTKGRTILGLGSGEQLNIEPYGMKWSTPVAKLAEGLEVIDLLMNCGSSPVNFEGKHFHLRDAVMGLDPYGARAPEIWLAAHGPRMLGLTAKYADGWIPTKMSPEEYRSSLGTIRDGARDLGRDTESFTPGMLAYVILAPDEQAVERLLESPLLRMLCVLLPNRVFEQLGVTPPLGGDSSGSGFHDFIPTRVPRGEATRIVDAIPPRVVRHYAFAGTVEQVAEQIADYHRAGLRHLIMWNVTGLGDPSMTKFSYEAMDDLMRELKRA
ncbi:LLM class flavin-dependent oxidoreductase [Rhodococcus koreensis]